MSHKPNLCVVIYEIQEALMIKLLIFILLPVFAYSQNYIADTAKSKIEWTGSKIVGKHTGVINLKEGFIISKNNKFENGTFSVNMKSINTTDLKDSMKEKLDTHLKSDDFFSVEKHPVSKIVIKKVTELDKGKIHVVGDLTIKDVTAPVEFDSHITEKGKEVTAHAEITFDRTKYNIRYGSGKFFDNLGDKLINDEVKLNVHLVLVKTE